jgi:glutaconate CoA-transferase subunit B
MDGAGLGVTGGEFTIDEWLCVALARTIRDGEIVFHGFGSPCAQVAMYVAKRTHAPHMVLVEGSTYALDPEPAFIPPTSNDWSLLRGAAHILRFEELFDLGARGELDRMFLSGGQIDAHGNTNVTAVGGLQRPKVKLGGGGGGCNLSATVGELSLWTTRHRSGRVLVEQCDVITDLGHRTPLGTRAEMGLTGAGPATLVSELGVLDFPDGRMRLREVFPDVEPDEVLAATGFELAVADDLRTVPPPRADEIAVVRSVDRLGVRRSEFDAGELERRFRWSTDRLACAACT